MTGDDMAHIRDCLYAVVFVRGVDTPTMGWGFRKRLKLGPLGLNLTKRGASVSGKFGRFSTNTRTRRLRVGLPFGGWWHSRSPSRRTRSRR